MKVKEESEKSGLKLNIQKTKIMASSPIISSQIDEETIETVREAPPNTTVSLNSQRLREKLPEVTGTSRGNPEFPEVT